MATRNPHLIFNNPAEGTVTFKQRPRYGGETEQEEESERKDYSPKRADFIQSRDRFLLQREERINNRNEMLTIPAHIEYVQITFHDVFDSSSFENSYRLNFGLSPVNYTSFNAVALFAIVNTELFSAFLQEIESFINTSDHINDATYNTDIKIYKGIFFLFNRENHSLSSI